LKDDDDDDDDDDNDDDDDDFHEAYYRDIYLSERISRFTPSPQMTAKFQYLVTFRTKFVFVPSFTF
jgi:hypothetical protein